MMHQQFKEWLQLSLYDELSEYDELLLQEHLMHCESCKEDLAQLRSLHQTLDRAPRPQISEQTLWQARQGLRAVLRYEQSRRTVWQRFVEAASKRLETLALSWHPQLGYALGGVVLFVLGLALGSRDMVFESPLENAALSTISDGEDLLYRGDVEISNVRFLDSDASDGGVEFVFEAIRPIHLKGSISDPQVQKVLAYAVVNEQNPGVRLRAINAVGASEQGALDSEIKEALITALKSDPNPGVRKEAFASLTKFPADQEVISALLHVLTYDDNAALRIEAINMLETRSESQPLADQDFVDVLKARMETDENSYIRSRARTVLQEIGRP